MFNLCHHQLIGADLTPTDSILFTWLISPSAASAWNGLSCGELFGQCGFREVETYHWVPSKCCHTHLKINWCHLHNGMAGVIILYMQCVGLGHCAHRRRNDDLYKLWVTFLLAFKIFDIIYHHRYTSSSWMDSHLPQQDKMCPSMHTSPETWNQKSVCFSLFPLVGEGCYCSGKWESLYKYSQGFLLCLNLQSTVTVQPSSWERAISLSQG